MAQGASARRYAEAAFDLATRQNTLDRWQTDLQRAAAVVATPDLMRLLDDPEVPRPRKHELLDATIAASVDPMVRNLLYLLADRNRLGLMPRIHDEFTAFYNRR